MINIIIILIILIIIINKLVYFSRDVSALFCGEWWVTACLGRTGTCSKTTNPMTQHLCMWDGPGGMGKGDGPRPICLMPNPLRVYKMECTCLSPRPPFTQPEQRQTQTEACERKNIDTRLQAEGDAKTHKCKYFKRSVPLHHCWLCLILWASTNNGRWDSFCHTQKKDRKKNWENCCFFRVTAIPHQTGHNVVCAIGECAMHHFQMFFSLRPLLGLTLSHLNLTFSSFYHLDWAIRV